MGNKTECLPPKMRGGPLNQSASELIKQGAIRKPRSPLSSFPGWDLIIVT